MISGKYHLGSIGHRRIWHLARTSPTLIAVEIRTSLTFKTDGGVGDEALRPNKGGNHMFVLPLQQEVGCEWKQRVVMTRRSEMGLYQLRTGTSQSCTQREAGGHKWGPSERMWLISGSLVECQTFEHPPLLQRTGG